MEWIQLQIKERQHDKIVLVNSKGDTYTSKSEELMDFLHESPQPSKPEQDRLKTDCNVFIDRAIAMMKNINVMGWNAAGYNGIVSLLMYAKESHSKPEQVGKEAIEFAEWKDNHFERTYPVRDKIYTLREYDSVYKIKGVNYGQHYSMKELYKLFNPKRAEQGKQEAPGDEKAMKLIKTLQKIIEWKFPETGRFLDREEKQPMSYGAAYGSNGERDYIIRLAQEAITEYASSTPTPVDEKFQWTDELVKEMIYRKLIIPEHYFGNLQKCLDEYKGTTPTPVLQSIEGKEDDFEDYMRNARDQFVNRMNAYERSIAVRVACENILIAFDQMRERILAKDKTNEAGRESLLENLWRDIDLITDFADFDAAEKYKMIKEKIDSFNKTIKV